MRTMLLFLALVTGLSFGRLAWAAEEQKPSPDEAKAAALTWLKLVDDGKYAESWQAAASFFKTMVTEQRWADAMNQVRDPLGDVTKRTCKSAEFTHDLPHVPKGDYWVIQFETIFDGTPAIETVTPMLDRDGKWHVSGYFIKPAS